MPSTLVVTPDPSSGGTVRQLLRKQGRLNTKLFACHDDFSVGPLVQTVSPEALLRRRHRYWVQIVGCSIVGLDPRYRIRDDVALRRLLMESEQIEVLLGGTGREQLFLLGFAAMLRDCGIAPDRVEIFQYPSELPWDSLGMRGIEAMADRPLPVRLTVEVLRGLLELWSVVCDPSPERLFMAQGAALLVPEFRYLQRGLADLATSYPDVRTGLSLADDRLLLGMKPEWTKSARIVANAMLGDRQGQGFGDGFLFHRLLRLADDQSQRLAVEMRGAPSDMLTTEVRITDFGVDCLVGRENFVAVNGVKMWIGGVKMDSVAGRIWYRDGMSLVR